MTASLETKRTPPLILTVRAGGGRFISGIIMALLCLSLCALRLDFGFGIVTALLYAAAGLVSIRCENRYLSFFILALWAAACVFLSAYAPVLMVEPQDWAVFFRIGKLKILLNVMAAAFIYGIMLAAFGKIRKAVIAASLVLLVFSTGNAVVFQFRSVELKPTDFLSVTTALNVVSQYSFQLNDGIVRSWLMHGWLLFAAFALPEEKPLMPALVYRLSALSATLLCALCLGLTAGRFPLFSWYNFGSVNNGYYLNFCVNLSRCFVREPEGYSDSALAELEAAYASEADVLPSGANAPTILVIMNESFADLSVLGDNFNTHIPATPVFDSIEENAIKGYALCSVFGGNTPNSEFEFLTGNSLAWLPNGSVTFQQHINDECYSLPRLLSSLGYETAATHPYLSSGWQRTRVYPLLGFDSYSFVEDYPQQKLLRGYVSDREMYEYLLDKIDGKGNAPLFLFGVSMQNHGGYQHFPQDGYIQPQRVELEGYSGTYDETEVYLSVLREADSALGFLMEELEKREEDIVLVFFGDHLPNLAGQFYEEVHGSSFDTLSQQLLQYKVPFFIWSNNIDIEPQTVECTSLSYLSRYMLEAAGFGLPPYYRFLKELEENIPSINAMGYYSRSRQDYIPFSEAPGTEADWLELYQICQYNCMFDEKELMPSFFGEYMD